MYASAVLTGVAPDGPTVCGDDMLAQVQADACACAVFGIHPAAVFHPEELLKDVLTELSGDPRTGIRHSKMQDCPIPRRCILPEPCHPHHPSGERVLQCVGQHVVQHHQQPRCVALAEGTMEDAAQAVTPPMTPRPSVQKLPHASGAWYGPAKPAYITAPHRWLG